MSPALHCSPPHLPYPAIAPEQANGLAAGNLQLGVVQRMGVFVQTMGRKSLDPATAFLARSLYQQLQLANGVVPSATHLLAQRFQLG